MKYPKTVIFFREGVRSFASQGTVTVKYGQNSARYVEIDTSHTCLLTIEMPTAYQLSSALHMPGWEFRKKTVNGKKITYRKIIFEMRKQ